MSKPAKLTLVLVNIEELYSHLNLGRYYRIEWLDVDRCEISQTAVDPQYNNYRHWRHLVEQPTIPYGIYSNLITTSKRTRGGLGVISADSLPHLQETLTHEQIELLVEALITEQAGDSPFQ